MQLSCGSSAKDKITAGTGQELHLILFILKMNLEMFSLISVTSVMLRLFVIGLSKIFTQLSLENGEPPFMTVVS